MPEGLPQLVVLRVCASESGRSPLLQTFYEVRQVIFCSALIYRLCIKAQSRAEELLAQRILLGSNSRTFSCHSYLEN